MQSGKKRGDPAVESLGLLHVVGTQPPGGARLPLGLLLCLVTEEENRRCQQYCKKTDFSSLSKRNPK